MEYTLVTIKAKMVQTTERFIVAEKQINRKPGTIYVPGKTVRLHMTASNVCSNGHRMGRCAVIILPKDAARNRIFSRATIQVLVG